MSQIRSSKHFSVPAIPIQRATVTVKIAVQVKILVCTFQALYFAFEIFSDLPDLVGKLTKTSTQREL